MRNTFTTIAFLAGLLVARPPTLLGQGGPPGLSDPDGAPAPLAQTGAAALRGPGGPSVALTRQQAVDTALAHNPALAAALEQVAQARARRVQQVAFPDPALSADVTGEPNLSQPSAYTGRDLELDLAVPFPTKFLSLHRMGNADVAAAQFNYEQLRQQTAAQAAQAYDALLVALQHQSDLEEGHRLAQEFVDKTTQRFQQGTVARLDVIKAQVDLAEAENELLANSRDLANARAGLNRVLGRLLAAPLIPADTLVVPPALPALTVLETLALRTRPELRGLARQREGAHAATGLARQYWLPDLDISLAKNLAQGSPSTYTTAIGFSFPLFFWNHQSGEVAEAHHYEAELAADYRDMEAQVDQDVRTAYATAATALQQAVYLRDQLLPEARDAFRIATVSYGLGGSSALEVLDARRTLLAAESDYAEALGAANDARADLERAIGTTLDSIANGDSHDH